MTNPEPGQQQKGYWRRPNNYIRILTLIFVAGYTGVQIWQTCLIRDQLTLGHPPQLIISHIAIYKKGNREQPPVFAEQQVIEGTAWIINAGREKAVINKVECIPYWGRGPLPLWPVYYGNKTDACKTMVIQDGVSLAVTDNQNVMQPGNVGKLEFSIAVPPAAQDDFYLLGYVIYQDRLTPPTRRALFFGRRYDRSKGYFVKVDNPGYEHEE
jgi:hypothetical protein